MYLNTQSGLTPALDAIGQIVQANQQNDAQMRGLANAGVAGLRPSDAPQGNFLTRMLGIAPDAPVSPAQPAPPAQTASLAPGQPPVAATGGASPNAQAALDYFTGKGLSPIAAQGLVGGFARESGPGLNPTAVNPNGGASYVAQWTGPRLAAFQQFAANGSRDPNDLKTQLDFAWSELTGSEKATLAALQKAQNPLQATVAALGYERPEGWSASNPLGAKDFGKRLAATVGLGQPAGATAYAPSGADPSASPGQRAIAAAAPPASAPMPVATSDHATVASSVPGSAPSPAAPAAPDGGPVSMDQIKALVQNPATRSLGLQMWQQTISPKSVSFGKPGEVAFVNGRPAYQVPAAPMSVSPGGTVIDPGTGKPLFASPANLDLKQTGADAFGNPVYGTFDPRTGGVSPLPPAAGGGTTPGALSGGLPAGLDASKRGPDFLRTLDPTLAARVQGIIDGRAPYPTSYELTKPAGRFMAALVNQTDPTFDASNATSRAHTRQDFTSGATSKVITAGNTAIQHLGVLSDAAEKLQNSSFPTANWIGQGLAEYGGKNTAGIEFKTALRNYTDEITKFYRGTGGTETEIQQRLKGLDPSMSPDQLRTAILTERELLQGKINALQDQWSNGMGPGGGQYPIIKQPTQAALDRIAQRRPSDWVGTAPPAAAPGQPPAAASTPAPAAPAATMPTVQTPDQARALPAGTRFRTPDGRMFVR